MAFHHGIARKVPLGQFDELVEVLGVDHRGQALPRGRWS
jgi:hypothetical protein